MSKANVRSFQAVEAFRLALLNHADSVAAALDEAEAEGERWLRWLEHDQREYWKQQRRAGNEALSRAKDAYRQKALYPDSSGARQSAIDELQEVRKCEANLERIESREANTKRHAVALKNEIQHYRGGAGRLRNLVNGTIPVASAALKEAVAQLERYAAAMPNVSDSPADGNGANMTRVAAEPAESSAEAIDPDELRRRTPGVRARATASVGGHPPVLPDVPAAARDVAANRASTERPGRYDLVTLALPAVTAPEDWHLYLERVQPAFEDDTGWHVGWAGATDGTPLPVFTVTFGKLEQAAPFLADLMRMPVGTLAVARENTLCRLLDNLGNTLWAAKESA